MVGVGEHSLSWADSYVVPDSGAVGWGHTNRGVKNLPTF
jgi:hypothetical protein